MFEINYKFNDKQGNKLKVLKIVRGELELCYPRDNQKDVRIDRSL